MMKIFADFCQFSAGKNDVSLKKQSYDHIFSKTSSTRSKKTADIVAKFLGENIFKITASFPQLAKLVTCKVQRPVFNCS
jgi:hypothetical protein